MDTARAGNSRPPWALQGWEDQHTKDGSFKAEDDRLECIDVERCCPTRAAYSILICSLCKNGRVFQANNFFVDMRKSGIQPEVGDYAAIVEERFGDERAFRVTMLHADVVKLGILPNEIMYKILERGYEGIAYFASAQTCSYSLTNLLSSNFSVNGSRFLE